MSAVKVISGVATAVVIFVVLGLDYFTSSPWPFAAFTFVVLLMAQLEFYRLTGSRDIYPPRLLGLVLGIVYLVFAFMGPYTVESVAVVKAAPLAWWSGDMELYWERLGNLILAFAVIAPLIYFLGSPRGEKREHSFESAMATTFGLIYVVFLGSYMLRIRFQSIGYALLFVCTAKSCDIGGYLAGSVLGRHKLHPESPRKTVEGLIGGFAVGIGVAILASRLFLSESFPIYMAVIYGILVSIASQIGDLGESMIKRRCGVKDSGDLIPGSGGALDFADCLLFSAPVAYYFVKFAILQ